MQSCCVGALLVICCFLRRAESSLQYFEVRAAVDKVTAVEDEDVVLPCSIPAETSISNLELRWFRETGDELVSFFRDQREDLEMPGDSYRGRAHLFTDELSDGNASLHLSRVQTSDADLYTCSAFVGLTYSHAEVKLRVEGRQPVIEVTEEDHSELEQEDPFRSHHILRRWKKQFYGQIYIG
ncbi:hypothetical protein MATL_G00173730 [Megalops atlanticus]|uniref:Ig-like domain-containing protein n=1 Tax=Megalops atlanticus TaxID=7932 RepID=A0A9D3T8D1_MEGAT|nr:hypothetical protein MATL_G00173730 [Megalops atlanticus]